MYTRITKLPFAGRHSLFLFGPRGTGKTFWLKQKLPNAIYFDLLDSTTFRQFLASPNRLGQIIPDEYDGWIIIDEVQKIPALLDEVHRLIESKKYKFVLTGSSARKLRRNGANLLAGRALRYLMHPLVWQELQQDFSLQFALNYGLLPGVYSADDPQKYLQTYVQTFLREEVLQEGLTRRFDMFANFLEIASFSQGSILNYSEIAREANIDRKTTVNYFSILNDLLLSIHLPVFTRKAKRRMVQHEKFYYFDVGVFRAMRPKGPLDLAEEIDGAALETLFLQHLRAINDYYDLGYKIYYWRTVDGAEVDFVLYGEKGLLAFEVKRNSVVTSKMLKSLKSFQSDYPMAKSYFIYGGNHREYHDAITAIPLVEALQKLPELLQNSQS